MSFMLPNLNGLRAFEVSGQFLNFRAAAEALGVTQGAVAQQVRGLETQLGQKLFVRSSKGLAFTAAGRAYHARIAEAFALIRDASEILLPDVYKVTISVTPTFAAKWLIPNLPDLKAQYPEVDLRVLATETVSSFESDGIDLAIRQGRAPSKASLESHTLFASCIIAVAAPSLVDDLDLPFSARQLADFPKLHDSHNLWQKFLSQMNVRDAAGRGTRVNQTALAIDAAIAGQGAALTSKFLVQRDIQSGRLVQISPQVFMEPASFHLLARKAPNRTQGVSRVMEWLLSVASSCSAE